MPEIKQDKGRKMPKGKKGGGKPGGKSDMVGPRE